MNFGNLLHWAVVFLVVALVAPLFFVMGYAQQAFLEHFKVDEFASIIITFGMTILAETFIQWIWSADFVRLETHFLRGSWELGPFFLPKQEMFMSAAALALCLMTAAFLRFTWIGKALRHVPAAAARASPATRGKAETAGSGATQRPPAEPAAAAAAPRSPVKAADSPKR